jgi:dynein heavy chain
MVGELNYGGRVTDDKDRRCIMSILSDFYTPEILDDEYRFSPEAPLYYAPPAEKSLEDLREYARQLPINDPPEVFGLHANAEISCARAEAYELFGTLLSLQPRAGGGGSTSAEEVVGTVTRDIESKIPPPWPIDDVRAAAPAPAGHPVAAMEARRWVSPRRAHLFGSPCRALHSPPMMIAPYLSCTPLPTFRAVLTVHR